MTSSTLCSATNQAVDVQRALLQAITGLSQLASQLATQFSTIQAAAAAEPWMEERATEVLDSPEQESTPSISTFWDELSVKELRCILRSYPIDRTSLPAAIERLRRSELIEALSQIQAMTN
jgi:hypothetical protein